MNEQVINVSEKLVDMIVNLTGIKKDLLQNFVKENGVNFIFEHPNTLEGITAAQKKKLLTLKDFINAYNEAEFLKETVCLGSSTATRQYFETRMQNTMEKEVFDVAMLGANNTIIRTVRLFEGTINEAPIYSREVVKAALKHDANAVILAHNHPGGTNQPSMADIKATERIKDALRTVNIKVLDHIIVAGPNKSYSFGENDRI